MATTVAILNSITTVLHDGESSTVSAPPSPQVGNWFAIKLLSAGGPTFTLTIDGNGNDIESIRGDGLNTAPQSTIAFLPYEYYRWHFLNINGTNAWWLTSPNGGSVETWEYAGPGNLALNAVAFTTIPLTFRTLLSEPSEFFVSDGAGGILCNKRFVGSVDMLHYLEYVSTSNNQEINVHIQLTAVVGAPTIYQGQGFRDSFFSGRAGGTFLKSIGLEAGLIILPGESIKWEGILDPFTTMTGSVVVNSDLLIKPL